MQYLYSNEEAVRTRVAAGGHRKAIGGMWDEIGGLQLRWLIENGMEPHHRLLDVGCGAGRLAVKAVPYLLPHHYFGQDISPALLTAARQEIENVCASDRIGPGTFVTSSDFKAPSADSFDFIMAQSVFTHLGLDRFALCLNSMSARIADSGKFYATFFACGAKEITRFHERGGVTTSALQDPFHYHPDAIRATAEMMGWRATWIGEWDHPRDQQMVELTRF